MRLPVVSGFLTLFLLGGALLGGPAGAGGHDFGRLNPEAPPETSQFAFLVGVWDCTTRFMKPDGSGYGEGKATWTGAFILDGYAIQDDWLSSAGGKTFRGTNIRSFNTKTGKWDCRWLPASTLQWSYYQAAKEGETMVMVGGEGTDAFGDYVDRNVFYDITPDHWRWRKDRSHDGGKTWTEGVGFIEATRMPDSED